jgi:glycosyltransferase involved in cell wall biosynthesis/SAM-dependent methyltransferase
VKLKIDLFLARQDNVQLDVISAEDGPLRKEYEDCGINVSIVDCRYDIGVAQYEAFRDRMRDLIRRGGYDVVYVNTLMLYWAVDAAYAADVPCIWNIHESIDYTSFYDVRIPDPSVRACAHEAITKANRLVFVCRATADMFTSHDKFGTIEVVYNGIDASQHTPATARERRALRKQLGLPADGKLVTIVGTVCPRKGQLDFARCAAALLEGGRNAYFAVVGAREAEYLKPYLDQVKQVVQKHPGQILLINETPATDYLRASDVFVCSSYEESFPMVVLEAMSCGLPIVTTPVFGIAEQVEDGKTGLFYAPGNVEQMGNAIERVLDDSRLAADLGRNAREAAATTFSGNRMVEKYYEILQQAATEEVNEIAWLSAETKVHLQTAAERSAPPKEAGDKKEAENGGRKESAAPAVPQARPTKPSLRANIAAQYLVGEGIEIGALHNPLAVPPTAKVKYLDRLPVETLRKHYPELSNAHLVPVDILDDGERLSTVSDGSQDFVIANHFIEHCQNPILAMQNMLRVLKPIGVLFLAVPDKRFTFDVKRAVTSFEHLLKDYIEGPEWSKRLHFEEWVRDVYNVRGADAIQKRMQELLDIDYSIHYHVWTQAEAMEMVARLVPVLSFDVEHMSHHENEVLFILRKAVR